MVCQAEGSPEDPLSYQWYFNSQSIPGATRHILEKYALGGGRVQYLASTTENVARGEN